MPIFEFQCDDCGQPFEELVFSTSTIDDLVCPECGSKEIHKMISTFASKIAGGGSGPSLSASSAPSCAPSGI